MRRLEFSRMIRTLPGRARNSAEAAMYLAHVVRERHRLEHERRSLEKRIRRIEARLTSIAGAETKLTPALQPAGATPAPPVRATARTPRAPMPGLEAGQVTLQY
jgi:hypothetical protein